MQKQEYQEYIVSWSEHLVFEKVVYALDASAARKAALEKVYGEDAVHIVHIERVCRDAQVGDEVFDAAKQATLDDFKVTKKGVEYRTNYMEDEK
jgi:hypothetical protein